MLYKRGGYQPVPAGNGTVWASESDRAAEASRRAAADAAADTAGKAAVTAAINVVLAKPITNAQKAAQIDKIPTSGHSYAQEQLKTAAIKALL